MFEQVFTGSSFSFQCSMCEYSSTEKTNIRRHVKYQHLNVSDNVPCMDCGKVFKRKNAYKEHRKMVHFEQFWNNSFIGIKIVIWFHSDPATYLKQTSDSGSLEGQTWCCLLCGKQSSHLANGKRHVKFVHMKASEDAECPVCHKRFGRKQHLDRHMKTMHSDYYYWTDHNFQ